MTLTLMGSNHPEIEIADGEFSGAVSAKRCLFGMLGIEEKLMIALENYREFEGELLEQSLDQSILADDRLSPSSSI